MPPTRYKNNWTCSLMVGEAALIGACNPQAVCDVLWEGSELFCPSLALAAKDSAPAQILSYNRANRAVAVLCNHQVSLHHSFNAGLGRKLR